MSILDRIVAAKRLEVAEVARRRDEVVARARDREPSRPFEQALRSDGVALIGEIKRRSPSAGWIRPELSPEDVAASYAAAGAAAISVLTDGEFFGGSAGDLEAVRSAVSLPVLRKDFTIASIQVWEARAIGADAVLLIARILEDALLAELLGLALELGMGALVEVHNEQELDRALAAGAGVIGVNNRDLATFHTDLEVVLGLAPRVDESRVLVAESGIRGPDDVARMGRAGVNAVLVGETLMRSPDPGAAAAALAGHSRVVRETASRVGAVGQS